MVQINSLRDLTAFWIFGLANNFAYVIMLSAAEDIIKGQSKLQMDQNLTRNSTSENFCYPVLPKPRCHITSTGAILLADIIPSLIIKLFCPFIIDRVPFGFRHLLVCIMQALSFVIVAFSQSFTLSLIGIIFASLGSGLGENCLLALSSHYKRSTISAWSSGTGGAGIVGSVAYAALTEPKLFGLSPRNALLSMLIVPIIFALAYWGLLTPSPTVHRIKLLSPSTWIIQVNNSELSDGNVKVTSELNFGSKMRQIILLLHLMVPLGIVYFAEYLINSGLHQLLHFDCSHGFGLSETSQFRWYQTLYQLGVFISRSSVTVLTLPTFALYLLAVLQCGNIFVFYFQSLFHYIPHIGVMFTVIFVEGLFGGASYVNTFDRIHKTAPKELREFSLSIVAASDSFGVTIAGFSAILLHNHICNFYGIIYP
ncbi:hypothetical protein niasHT_006858 [Heterodera trifolii]|uniref:Battenin n=1 Tax=Heterodera trifolii TaxID=157864 RepID=A0ABD2LMS3_9BILA